MKQNGRLKLGLLAFLALAAGLFLAQSAWKKPLSSPPPSTVVASATHQAFYVELVEINSDHFLGRLFENLAAEPPLPPFVLKENKLHVKHQALQSYLGMDTAQEGLLFVTHRVVYNGVGREGAYNTYYVFRLLPGKVPLPAFTNPGALHLTSDDSLADLFHIRLFPAAILHLDQAPPGKLEARLDDGKGISLASPEEHLLSVENKTVLVTQEYYAPLPKGPIHQEDFKPTTGDLGSVEFSTRLSAKDAGRYEVVIE